MASLGWGREIWRRLPYKLTVFLAATPLGLGAPGLLSQGSLRRQPWANLLNTFGVPRQKTSRRNGQTPGRNFQSLVIYTIRQDAASIIVKSLSRGGTGG